MTTKVITNSPACRGTIFRYALAPVIDTRWLVLVSDEEELLAGEIHPASSSLATATTSKIEEITANAVRTSQQMLVNLTGSYIKNSIALARILTHFGSRLFSELDPQSIAELNALHPFHTQGAWLDVFQRLLHLK